jgi:4a-hydroxytetrahydrobiopterin dehydratase
MEKTMKKSCDLASKACVPCQGGVPPLPKEQVRNLLAQLGGGWQINASGHLSKQFKFKDFVSAMDFANKITSVAEQEAHHPDLTISWGSCSVEIWTHKIDGLTESDFILAAKTDTLV